MKISEHFDSEEFECNIILMNTKELFMEYTIQSGMPLDYNMISEIMDIMCKSDNPEADLSNNFACFTYFKDNVIRLYGGNSHEVIIWCEPEN